MNPTYALELPAPLYHALVKAAKTKGTTPQALIAASLPTFSPAITQEERDAANARLRQHIVSAGAALGSDNEEIDADLAREYGNALSLSEN